MVRKVVAYELLSLDGVAEHPDEFITDFDDVMRENLDRVIATQDAVLLGRRTYDDWAEFWPTSDIEPFASFINAVEKFVVTLDGAGRNLGQHQGRRWRPCRVRHQVDAAARRRHRRPREHCADPIAPRGGLGRRTASCHRPGPAQQRSQAFRHAVVEAAEPDSQHHLTVRVPSARLPSWRLSERGCHPSSSSRTPEG
jgi:hypothetical protein